MPGATDCFHLGAGGVCASVLAHRLLCVCVCVSVYLWYLAQEQIASVKSGYFNLKDGRQPLSVDYLFQSGDHMFASLPLPYLRLTRVHCGRTTMNDAVRARGAGRGATVLVTINE